MMSERFDVTDVEEANSYLRMEKYRDRNVKVLWLTQEHYMENILKRFGMRGWKPGFPSVEDIRSKTERSEIVSEIDEDASDLSYSEIIGSLMFQMDGLRTHIAYVVGKLCQIL